MKNYHHLLVIFTLCILCGCHEDSKEESFLQVEDETLLFSVQEDSKELKIKSNTDWSISSLPSWIRASAVSGIGNSVVMLTAEENDAMDDRESRLKVYTNDGAVSCEISVIQEGTHVSPIQIDNISKRIFSGKANTSIEDSIVVTSNTRWIIEGPAWLKATFNGRDLSLNGDAIREGAGVIYLSPAETHTSDEAREAVITIKTLTATKGIEIPVRQLGKDDIQCTNPIILSDGFLFGLKYGANVAAFRWMVYEEELPANEISYDNIKTYWAYNKATDGVLYVGNALPETQYYLYFIGIDNNNYFTALSHVNKQIIKTATDINQPMATISNAVYSDGEWNWDVTMNSLTKGYYVGVFYKSFFEGMNLAIMKPYFAYLMMYTETIYFHESTTLYLETTEDLVLCTWAVGTNDEISTTIDMYIAENKESEVKKEIKKNEQHCLQMGIIDPSKFKDTKFNKSLKVTQSK